MLWWPDTTLGALLFFAMKVWLLTFPLICYFGIDRQRISFSPVRKGGLGVGALLGFLICCVILGVYGGLGDRLIDPQLVRSRVGELGLDRAPVYIGCALYWITINSLLEEYVWRWFVVRQCEKLFGPLGAVLVSALGFTVHHILAMQLYMPPVSVALSATGIFIGGAAWSWCYVRYRSIWPGYVSHAIVDIAVFGIGYALIFGG